MPNPYWAEEDAAADAAAQASGRHWWESGTSRSGRYDPEAEARRAAEAEAARVRAERSRLKAAKDSEYYGTDRSAKLSVRHISQASAYERDERAEGAAAEAEAARVRAERSRLKAAKDSAYYGTDRSAPASGGAGGSAQAEVRRDRAPRGYAGAEERVIQLIKEAEEASRAGSAPASVEEEPAPVAPASGGAGGSAPASGGAGGSAPAATGLLRGWGSKPASVEPAPVATASGGAGGSAPAAGTAVTTPFAHSMDKRATQEAPKKGDTYVIM